MFSWLSEEDEAETAAEPVAPEADKEGTAQEKKHIARPRKQQKGAFSSLVQHKQTAHRKAPADKSAAVKGRAHPLYRFCVQQDHKVWLRLYFDWQHYRDKDCLMGVVLALQVANTRRRRGKGSRKYPA